MNSHGIETVMNNVGAVTCLLFIFHNSSPRRVGNFLFLLPHVICSQWIIHTTDLRAVAAAVGHDTVKLIWIFCFLIAKQIMKICSGLFCFSYAKKSGTFSCSLLRVSFAFELNVNNVWALSRLSLQQGQLNYILFMKRFHRFINKLTIYSPRLLCSTWAEQALSSTWCLLNHQMFLQRHQVCIGFIVPNHIDHWIDARWAWQLFLTPEN